MRKDLAKLIAERRIETVRQDPQQVAILRDQAAAHLASSRMIGHTDAEGAFSLAYDAIRKQLTALLLDHGFRARSAGSHAATGQAAAILLPGFDVETFEWLRLVRNATEYGSDRRPSASVADLQEAWEFADEVAQLIAKLSSRRTAEEPSTLP